MQIKKKRFYWKMFTVLHKAIIGSQTNNEYYLNLGT